MPTPHKHAEIIKAWADGHDIQIQYPNGTWMDLTVTHPAWDLACNYRIKPEPVVIEGFVDPLMLSQSARKNPYAIFRPNQPSSTYKRCTLIFYPDE